MEKTMKNTNDTSNISHGTLDDHRPLADSELDAVTGSAFPIVMAQMALATNRVNLSDFSIVKYLDSATP
jgi:hypothetical protein